MVEILGNILVVCEKYYIYFKVFIVLIECFERKSVLFYFDDDNDWLLVDYFDCEWVMLKLL